MTTPVIHVDVWADVVCPWCYIGKRRFEAGLAAYADARGVVPVEVRFRSFELMPTTPPDVRGSAAEFLARHLGISVAEAAASQRRVAAMAASVGLAYDFSVLQPANTLRAHQLIQLARHHRVQDEIVEALMRAHFVEGRHVGDLDELARLAADAGLDAGEVSAAVGADELLPAVRSDQQLARDLGITGVPFFVLDGRLAVSGAQPSEVFRSALAQAVEAA